MMTFLSTTSNIFVIALFLEKCIFILFNHAGFLLTESVFQSYFW